MKVSLIVGVALLGCALVVGTGISQDKKEKPKGMLPAGWKKLDLGKDQVLKIYDIQTKYRAKVKALKDQIAELETMERADMVGVLTNEQKELLRKLTIGETKKEEKKKPEKQE